MKRSSATAYCQVVTRLCASGLGEECGVGHFHRSLSTTLRMEALIASLLNLSPISRVALHRTAVSLSEIATEVAQELKMAEPQRPMEFRIEQGLMANCDASLLRVVFGNLLGNAVKYTGNGDNSVIELAQWFWKR